MTNWIKINLIGLTFLASTIVFCVGILFWLGSDSVKDRIHDISSQFFRLRLENRQRDATDLLNQALAQQQKNNLLDSNWAPLVRQITNGYKRLEYFLLIIASAPEEEQYYSEIANLIKQAPPAFHQQVKSKYLTDLQKIPNINQNLLNRYNLINKSDASSNPL